MKSNQIKQSNGTLNFIRMCYRFYKTVSKMAHLTETQRILYCTDDNYSCQYDITQ
jgi:hypothetical protein